MSPRPRTCTDEDVLKAAAHVVAKNPDWTLRDVGDQAGLSAATLVQRFGSKRDLKIRLLDYLNHCMGRPVLAYRAGDDRHRFGLTLFRMNASIDPDREVSRIARGEAR